MNPIYFLLFGFLSAWFIWRGWVTYRTSQQQAVLAGLALAMEKSLPLDAAIRALSDTFAGNQRDRVLELAQVLQAGATVPVALNRVSGVVALQAEFAARVGWEAGDLTTA